MSTRYQTTRLAWAYFVAELVGTFFLVVSAEESTPRQLAAPQIIH